MKKQNIITKLVGRFFGLNYDDVTSKTADEATKEKIVLYVNAGSEIERASMFGSEAKETEILKRGAVAFAQEAIELGMTVSSLEEIPLSANRTVLEYFRQTFPDFDKGASGSLGRHFKSSFEYVSSKPGALLLEGEAHHLKNTVMKKLERSKSPFFVELKRKARKRKLFEERLTAYCVMWWTIAMNYGGTLDNRIIDAIKRDNDVTKSHVAATSEDDGRQEEFKF